MSGDNSDTAPPDPIPNSEVKRISGDGSVGSPHVRVAHRQTPILSKETKKRLSARVAFFCAILLVSEFSKLVMNMDSQFKGWLSFLVIKIVEVDGAKYRFVVFSSNIMFWDLV
jgi:hypothetical protein